MRDPSAAGGSSGTSGPPESEARAPFLSVVIPAYNEAARIGDRLRRAADWRAAPGRLEGPAEIVVVDDGSSDATAALVEQEAARRAASATAGGAAMTAAAGLTVRLLRNGTNRGKGY